VVRELGSKRRETVWSLSAVGVRNLSSRISSKRLLLSPVREIENSANNGEILLTFWFVDNHSWNRFLDYGTIT